MSSGYTDKKVFTNIYFSCSSLCGIYPVSFQSPKTKALWRLECGIPLSCVFVPLSWSLPAEIDLHPPGWLKGNGWAPVTLNTKEGREVFRDFCTECVTMMTRKMTLLTTQTVCASKLMHFLSTYLTPRPPVTGSQMDFTKACDRLMCIHIKADRTVMRPRTSVFIAELKKTRQIQTGSQHAKQVQEDSDGPSTTERDLLPCS